MLWKISTLFSSNRSNLTKLEKTPSPSFLRFLRIDYATLTLEKKSEHFVVKKHKIFRSANAYFERVGDSVPCRRIVSLAMRDHSFFSHPRNTISLSYSIFVKK